MDMKVMPKYNCGAAIVGVLCVLGVLNPILVDANAKASLAQPSMGPMKRTWRCTFSPLAKPFRTRRLSSKLGDWRHQGRN